MTSQELAQQVEIVVKEAQSRILGIGDKQYSTGGHQKFETLTLYELLDELHDEVIDVVNYGVMLSLRIEQVRDASRQV